jgi:hypothetical protein
MARWVRGSMAGSRRPRSTGPARPTPRRDRRGSGGPHRTLQPAQARQDTGTPRRPGMKRLPAAHRRRGSREAAAGRRADRLAAAGREVDRLAAAGRRTDREPSPTQRRADREEPPATERHRADPMTMTPTSQSSSASSAHWRTATTRARDGRSPRPRPHVQDGGNRTMVARTGPATTVRADPVPMTRRSRRTSTATRDPHRHLTGASDGASSAGASQLAVGRVTTAGCRSSHDPTGTCASGSSWEPGRAGAPAGS